MEDSTPEDGPVRADRQLFWYFFQVKLNMEPRELNILGKRFEAVFVKRQQIVLRQLGQFGLKFVAFLSQVH